MSVETMAPPRAASTSDRLKAARAETAALFVELSEIDEARTQALLNGQSTSKINSRRSQVVLRLEELSALTRALERRFRTEERWALLDDREDSFERGRQLAERLKTKGLELKAAQDVADKIAREFEAMRLQTGGTYSANERLARHREQFTDIDESREQDA